jgi:hypothetical protein
MNAKMKSRVVNDVQIITAASAVHVTKVLIFNFLK